MVRDIRDPETIGKAIKELVATGTPVLWAATVILQSPNYPQNVTTNGANGKDVR